MKQIPLNNTMQLSASETRHYGTHDKTFSVSQMFAPTSKAEMMNCMKVLNDRLAAFFEDYELHTLKGEARDVVQTENYKRIGAMYEWFDVLEIVFEVKEGQGLFKVKTRQSKYAKFGVPCYDEIATQFNLSALVKDSYSWKPEAGKEVRVQIDTSGKSAKAINFEGLL